MPGSWAGVPPLKGTVRLMRLIHWWLCTGARAGKGGYRTVSPGFGPT